MMAIWNLQKTKNGARAICYIKDRQWLGDDEISDLQSTEDGCEVGKQYYVYTENGKLRLEKTDEIHPATGSSLYQSGNRMVKSYNVGTVILNKISIINDTRVVLWFSNPKAVKS